MLDSSAPPLHSLVPFLCYSCHQKVSNCAECPLRFDTVFGSKGVISLSHADCSRASDPHVATPPKQQERKRKKSRSAETTTSSDAVSVSRECRWILENLKIEDLFYGPAKKPLKAYLTTPLLDVGITTQTAAEWKLVRIPDRFGECCWQISDSPELPRECRQYDPEKRNQIQDLRRNGGACLMHRKNKKGCCLDCPHHSERSFSDPDIAQPAVEDATLPLRLKEQGSKNTTARATPSNDNKPTVEENLETSGQAESTHPPSLQFLNTPPHIMLSAAGSLQSSESQTLSGSSIYNQRVFGEQQTQSLSAYGDLAAPQSKDGSGDAEYVLGPDLNDTAITSGLGEDQLSNVLSFPFERDPASSTSDCDCHGQDCLSCKLQADYLALQIASSSTGVPHFNFDVGDSDASVSGVSMFDFENYIDLRFLRDERWHERNNAGR